MFLVKYTKIFLINFKFVVASTKFQFNSRRKIKLNAQNFFLKVIAEPLEDLGSPEWVLVGQHWSELKSKQIWKKIFVQKIMLRI